MLVLGALIAFPLTLHVLVLAGQAGLALALMAVVYLALLAPLFRQLYKRQPAAATGMLILLCSLMALLAWQLDKLALLYLPPVAINLWLMLLFGATLRKDSTPLISRIARLERGELTPELAAYTRRLTWIWTWLFLGMALESLLLALFAPLTLWSWFVNVWNYVLVATLFLGEQLYRRLRFTRYDHASPLALLRLMRGGGWQSVLKQRRSAP